jgi:hypothetical protein
VSADWESEDGRYRAFVNKGTVRVQEYIVDDGWFNVDTWVPVGEYTRETLDFADKILRELGL